MVIEAVRSLSLRAAHAFDTQVPSALERALHAEGFYCRRLGARDIGPYARRWY